MLEKCTDVLTNYFTVRRVDSIEIVQKNINIKQFFNILVEFNMFTVVNVTEIL